MKTRINHLKTSIIRIFDLAQENSEDTDHILYMTDEALKVLRAEGASTQALKKCRSELYREFELSVKNHAFSRILPAETKNGEKKGHVYAVQNEAGLVKIGRTTNPLRRINAIRTQSGKNIVQSYTSPL